MTKKGRESKVDVLGGGFMVELHEGFMVVLWRGIKTRYGTCCCEVRDGSNRVRYLF